VRKERWLTRHNIAWYLLVGFWLFSVGTIEMIGGHATVLQWIVRAATTIFTIFAGYKIHQGNKFIRESNAEIAEFERRRKLREQQRRKYREN
jgi:hypothetical protein